MRRPLLSKWSSAAAVSADKPILGTTSTTSEMETLEAYSKHEIKPVVSYVRISHATNLPYVRILHTTNMSYVRILHTTTLSYVKIVHTISRSYRYHKDYINTSVVC
eukprot:1330280-Pyramimonas_sp.AAC.1